MDDNLNSESSLLRSEEIDEVIGRPPVWLIQWGITLFFVLLVMVFALSYFIKYPDVVEVPFTIKSDIALTPISLNETGQILKVFVSEGAEIKKSDTLFIWESAINHQQRAFIAPLNGRVNFIDPLSNGQRIDRGKLLFFISPIKTTYAALLQVNNTIIGKLKQGQYVDLSLPEYPDANLSGNITFLSTMQKANGYVVKAAMIRELIQGKTIHLKDGMLGSARVIIANRRLIEKFIGKPKIKIP